jgi:hypothetical protein
VHRVGGRVGLTGDEQAGAQRVRGQQLLVLSGEQGGLRHVNHGGVTCAACEPHVDVEGDCSPR